MGYFDSFPAKLATLGQQKYLLRSFGEELHNRVNQT